MCSTTGVYALYRRLTIAVVGIGLASLVSGCSLQGEEYEGTWVVTESVPAEVSAVGHEAANSHLGLSMTYQHDRAQLGQRFCHSPRYQVSYLEAQELSQRYHIAPESLFANQDEVKQVRVTCAQRGPVLGETLLMQSNGNAYTVSDGIFYKLEKARAHTG